MHGLNFMPDYGVKPKNERVKEIVEMADRLGIDLELFIPYIYQCIDNGSFQFTFYNEIIETINYKDYDTILQLTDKNIHYLRSNTSYRLTSKD